MDVSALGSVRQIANVNGNVTLAESYEPYGSVLNSTGTASSIFAYAGEQIDTCPNATSQLYFVLSGRGGSRNHNNAGMTRMAVLTADR